MLMQPNESGKRYLTRTTWIYVAIFALMAVFERHHSTVLFWTDCAALALVLPIAAYYTTRRVIGLPLSKEKD